SLDLPVGHPAGFERLQPIVARLHVRLALCQAPAAAALVLAELRLLRKQHLGALLLPGLALVARGLGGLVAGLLELRRVLDLLLRRRRVGRVGDCGRRRRRLRLDRRLLATLGGGRLLVGAWALDVVLGALPARATPRTALADRAE